VATVRRAFVLLAFVLPLVLLLFGTGWGARGSAAAQFAILLSFPVQFVGLLAERWFFFAQANHTQNLYYRSVA
jgi:DMSO reductase anchor subunit